jgi:prenylcysteine oxidase / farnesylcysteine lyase
MRWLLLLVLPSALAFELPFGIGKLFASTIAPTSIAGHSEGVPSSTSRIAVIGAGAGGSSAAFWLSKAKARLGVNFEIDVYESGSYIGGRECPSFKHRDPFIEKKKKKIPGSTVVHPYDNSSLPELELGASIFVEANQNLWRASDEFSLTRRDFEDESYETAIWDGQNIIFSVRCAFALVLPSLILFWFSSTADGGIQPKCYGDMATCHPNEQKHCMKTFLIHNSS